MEEQKKIRISVRNLVEFILREGDIDNRTAAGTDKEVMQLGSKIHRKIQRQMGSGYRAEVSLKTVIPYNGFDLQVEGRADGIMEENGRVIIDEIKGTLKDLEHIKEPVGVHLAQAKCYAYIFASQNDLEDISVQMTYCQMETEEIRRFREDFRMNELEEWFINVAGKYEKWARFQVEWREIRNQSAKGVEFPFPYRDGQKKLVTSVYRSFLRKKKLFIQAPTGVGKTIASVFPAVKAVGEGLAEKIFYLTAKTITRTVAEQAFVKLREQELKMKVITLTAKDKICFCEETLCNPDHCPYAKGHYDRVNDAVFELLTSQDELSRNSLEEQAKKHEVCPFEMSLDVSSWADVVICDYNYAFDPNAHLKRFFSEGCPGEYLFLVDEAHNLVDRGREMYSASLYKEEFLEVKSLVKGEDPKLARRLDECNKQLLALKKECENYQVLNSVSHFSLKLLNLMAEFERYLEEAQNETVRDAVLNLYFEVRHFLNMFDKLDENYIIYSELEQGGRFKIKLFCVNPSVNLKEYLDFGISTIFFSATLLPVNYYKELLSCEKDDYAIYVDSPFAAENRVILIGNDVSTRYTRRSKEMYQTFAEYIHTMAQAKKGNYLVFFPSYRLMEDVYEIYRADFEDENTECVMQAPNMREEDREEFLQRFEEAGGKSLLGFCVMGGIFSEGIDLTEDRLIGAAIIGTGLPQVCNEREMLKDYFTERGMRGFDYAYLYPGMNKVLQAAGRVIRTDDDKGVIMLLDERFLLRDYQVTFPKEWIDYQRCSQKNAEEKIMEFWKDQEIFGQENI